MRLILWLIIVAHFPLLADGLIDDRVPRQPRLEVGYAFGKWIGIRKNYAEIDLFVPAFTPTHDVWFVDCKGYLFENGKWAANAGVGFRRELEGKSIVGANFYYDFLDGKYQRGFNRLGGGLEWLNHLFDIRLNGYFPVGDQAHLSTHFHEHNYPGGYYFDSFCKEYVIGNGWDAEVGAPLDCWCQLRLYSAVGPYYYFHPGKTHYFGGQARMELSFNSWISVQVRGSYDPVNRSHIQGKVQISVPIEALCSGNWDLCWEDVRLQPVQREGIPFTKTHKCFRWNW